MPHDVDDSTQTEKAHRQFTHFHHCVKIHDYRMFKTFETLRTPEAVDLLNFEDALNIKGFLQQLDAKVIEIKDRTSRTSSWSSTSPGTS